MTPAVATTTDSYNERLAERGEKLAPAERRVAQFLVDLGPEATLLSAAALAKQLGAAPASVLKSFVWKWDSHEGVPGWLEGVVRPSGSRTTAIGFRQRDARTLSMLWEDGHRDDFDVRDLRLACHCALCIEEMSGRKLLDPKTVRPDVSPRVISSIGNYAIGIDWSDGHNSGIYSFDHLRSLGERAAGKMIEDV